MKRSLFFVSVLCLTQVSMGMVPPNNVNQRRKAFIHGTILENEITTGCLVGYATGLVPVAGQAFFPLLLAFGSDNPNTNFKLFAASAVVGHVAGVATISTAAYYAYSHSWLSCLLGGLTGCFGHKPEMAERLVELEARLNRLEMR